MVTMVRTSYLRAFEPLEVFPQEERGRWLAHSEPADSTAGAASRRWLVSSALPDGGLAEVDEGAFVRRLGEAVLICPRRTKLRMLAGLLAFRGSVPEAVAEAFIPESQARRAAHELAVLGDHHPHVRSHILHANWHVPLRWFVAFSDSDRILTEDKGGLRIRYEVAMGQAKKRLEHALSVLEESWLDEGVTEAIRELTSWVGEFSDNGLLELDYGSVASTFEPEVLVDDHSAAELAASLEALEAGDVTRSGEIFSEVADRWTQVRTLEVMN